MLVNAKCAVKQNFVLQVINNVFQLELYFFLLAVSLIGLAKLVWDSKERIVALGHYCTDLTALSSYHQDLGLIFSQYCPCAWLKRYFILREWHLHLTSMQSHQTYNYCKTHKKMNTRIFLEFHIT